MSFIIPTQNTHANTEYLGHTNPLSNNSKTVHVTCERPTEQAISEFQLSGFGRLLKMPIFERRQAYFYINFVPLRSDGSVCRDYASKNSYCKVFIAPSILQVVRGAGGFGQHMQTRKIRIWVGSTGQPSSAFLQNLNPWTKKVVVNAAETGGMEWDGRGDLDEPNTRRCVKPNFAIQSALLISST